MELQIIAAVATIIAANFGLMKFLLRDMHKDMVNMEKKQEEFSIEMRHVNNRLDGLYRVILDRTYGKNIPEELK